MNENNKKNIWEEIDYSRPTIIEASAGTGKTYTLEHIVLELIINHDISINEILIVTFTEKAAGEIKERIRKIIASEFDRLITEKSNNQDAINKLKIALDIFDSADISTIHGFCKKILSQYAFENNSALSQEISKDTYTIEAFNNVILSEEFKNMGGVDILNGFFNNTPIEEIGKKFKFFEKHNENALNNTILGDYEEEGINPDDFKKNIRELKEQTARILNLGNFDPNIKYEINIFSPIADNYSFTSSSTTKDAKTVCQEKLKKLDKALSNILNHRIPLQNQSSFTKDLTEKNFYKDGQENPKYKLTDINIYQNLGKIYDNLFREVRPLCKQIDDSFEKYRKHFEKCLVDLVLKERKRLKEEHQTISFDDLIINLDNALQPNASNSVALINALRGKYKIALIDEFQDTDALQWDIFSRIFTNHYEKEYPKNSFSESQNSLIVVGDPKQAIYKFRGADLNTYLLAKNIIKNDLNGQTKQLTTTYRCTNEMVEAFNTFFDNEWFNGEKEPEGAQNQKLEYSKVDHPENNLKTTKWFPNGFSTINIVNSDFKNFNDYIKKCALIIKKLHGIKITDFKNEKKEKIIGDTKYSDFCFLVKTNGDATKVADILKQYKLPYVLKKDSSLYESDEAKAIIIILKFLLEPNNRKLRHAALLTDFFDVHPRDIKNLENISSLDLPCFSLWLEYLNASRWENLFHSMLYDSGLYFRLTEKIKTDITAEIKLGIYNQLFEELLVAAKEKQLSIYEFPSFLKGIRNKSDDDEVDGNSLKKVTDDPRIQIMTMHSSKGLEFKFVFYCAGFCETLSPHLKNCHYSRYDEESKTIKTRYFNLDNAPNKIKDIIKYDDKCEVRRLTYVAITRAEYMIFFPSGNMRETGLPLNYNTKYGNDNPLSKFISKGLQTLDEKKNGIISLIDIDETYSFSKNNNDEEAHSELDETRDTDTTPIYDLPNLMRNKISLDSFSSINQHHKEAHKEISFDDENEKEDDETIGDFTVEKSEIQKATTLLPPGATFGKCFHEIMEQLAKGTGGVDFKTVAALPERYIFTDKRLEEIVAPAMQKYGIVNQYIFGENNKIIDSASNELKRMIWNTLKTPIEMLGGKTLGSIQTADMKAELEFYINKNDYLTEEQKNNIMIGFIDLLFRVDGKYYILDWKTNMLQGYDSDTVLEAMEEANYTLQHEIYSVATIQWLEKLFGTEAASLLGGSIYMFVRGGASQLGDKAGCYEKVWSPDDFAPTCERIKGEINQAISFEQQNSY